MNIYAHEDISVVQTISLITYNDLDTFIVVMNDTNRAETRDCHAYPLIETGTRRVKFPEL